MKQFLVAKGTNGRLVNIATEVAVDYSLREDKVFSEGDVVFDPMSIFAEHKMVTRDHGFRTGDAAQRAKYVWVVDTKFVTEQDDEAEDE